MTERIDHAAEARKHIEWAHEQQAVDGEFTESVHHNATLAVAEATLALVEQQRIGNLIAASQMEGGPYKDANSWTVNAHDADGRYESDEDANVFLRREIREGLGL